jgi:hypothetical protein
MVQSWWVAPPLGLSAVLLGVFRRKGSRRSKKDEEAARDDSGLSFSCERVCTSDMLLKRLGTLAKVRASPVCVRGARALLHAPPCACSLPRASQLTRSPGVDRSPHQTRVSLCAACRVRPRLQAALSLHAQPRHLKAAALRTALTGGSCRLCALQRRTRARRRVNEPCVSTRTRCACSAHVNSRGQCSRLRCGGGNFPVAAARESFTHHVTWGSSLTCGACGAGACVE